MDWDNFVIILLWMWVARWVLGAGYGAYLLQKNRPFTWQTSLIAGPVFWIGYCVGKAAKLITNKIKGVS